MFPGLTQIINMLTTGLETKDVSKKDKERTNKAITALRKIDEISDSSDKDKNQQLETIITDLMKDINKKD